jgi:hypothetical protein
MVMASRPPPVSSASEPRGSAPLPLGQAPHRQVAAALDHQQVQVAVALDLQRQHAVELQRGGEQHRGRHRLAEQRAHRRRVVLALEHGAPARVEAHDLAAHRESPRT